MAARVINDTIINDTAFSTGVELNLILAYKSTGKVGSEPTRKIVVLKFEKLIKNATTKAPIIAGLKNGIVISQITCSLVALKLNAASSSTGSNFFRRAPTKSMTKVEQNENCPITTSQKLGARIPIFIPRFSSR